jgi:Xaa-Pro aminopeptidase
MILFDYDKASRLMKDRDIDVLLPNSLLNAGYLADHWKHELVASFGAYMTGDDGLPYLFLVGLPQEQAIEPFVTCRTGGEEKDMAYTGVWIEDKRRWGPALPNREETAPFGSYDRVYRDPLEAAAEALRERSLAHATVGLELRYLGVESYLYLKSLLPEARFADALSLMNELRMIKTDEEVQRMRVAAQATEQATEFALATVEEGCTGLDLERAIGTGHYRAGVRHEWCHTNIGPSGAHIDCPNDTSVHPGDVIRLDVGSSYRHYQSDISRVGVFGEPSAELLTAHSAMRKALEAVINAAKPGVSGEHLYEVGNSVVDGEGCANYLTVVGHGLGRDVHEIPFLQRGESRLLEPGMTFSIELVTTLSDLGCIALEDEIVITPDGSEPLSTKGRELYIIE